MTGLNRGAVEALLPCYLCGDLPAEINEAIEGWLSRDAELKSRLDTLGQGRDACIEAIALLAEEVPDLALELDLSLFPRGDLEAGEDSLDDALADEEATMVMAPVVAVPPQSDSDAPSHTADTVVDSAAQPVAAPQPATAPAPAPAGSLVHLLVGLAAAAALVLSFASGSGAPAQEVALTHSVAAAGPDFVAGTEPAVLRQALLDRGVSPALAMVPDLSAQGYQLVGVEVSPARPGVAVVYTKDGQRFVCQIFGAMITSSNPDRVEQVQGVTLRGFSDGDNALVAWTSGTRTCIFSGPASLDALFAEAAARIQRIRKG